MPNLKLMGVQITSNVFHQLKMYLNLKIILTPSHFGCFFGKNFVLLMSFYNIKETFSFFSLHIIPLKVFIGLRER